MYSQKIKNNLRMFHHSISLKNIIVAIVLLLIVLIMPINIFLFVVNFND